MFRFFSILKKPVFYLFLFAFFLRGAVVLVKIDSFDDDPDRYSALAENLRTAGVFGEGETPTAFRPPLYPFLLRLFYLMTPSEGAVSQSSFLLSKQSATALFHWILGVLTVLIVYKLALILTFPKKWGCAAAILTAVDPLLLAESRLVMTETLAAFLGVFIIWLLTLAMRPRKGSLFFFLGIGILSGLSALCRPVFLLFGGLIFLGLLNYSRMRKLPLSMGTVFLAGFAATVIPWGIRNRDKMGVFTLTTTHGGYTLLLANNTSLYEYNKSTGPFAGPWDPESFHREWESTLAEESQEIGITSGVKMELFQDRLAKDTAHDVMSNDIAGAGLAALIRFGNLWQFLPYKTSSEESVRHRYCRYLTALFYFFEIPLAFIGLCHICAPLVSQRRRQLIISPYWSNWSWLIFLLLSIQIPHLLYWTNIRMRAPLMTVVSIFAVVGLRFLLAKKEDRPVVSGGFPFGEGKDII